MAAKEPAKKSAKKRGNIANLTPGKAKDKPGPPTEILPAPMGPGKHDITPILEFLGKRPEHLRSDLMLLEDALDIAVPEEEKDTDRVLKAVPRDTLRKMVTYLQTLRDTGNKAHACSSAGITYSTTYSWRNHYPQFRVSELVAVEMSTDDLVEEARRRAYDGIVKPAGWYQGRPGAYVREYSDNLLMFMIKAKRPEFRDNYQEGVQGGVYVSITAYAEDKPIDVTPREAPKDESGEYIHGIDDKADLKLESTKGEEGSSNKEKI